MSQTAINLLSQKLYVDSKKYREIASKAVGKQREVLLRKADNLMKRSNLVAGLKPV